MINMTYTDNINEIMWRVLPIVPMLRWGLDLSKLAKPA